MSFMKERDWLEKMATEGWLLTNITLGMIYRFVPIDPCEKVYEIERFAISPHSTVTDLTAKARALDIATQFGWQQITHDEDLNYYFVKDKAGDETDEFYDDEESRKERAERYRRRFCLELPFCNLITLVVIGLIYFLLAYFMNATFSQYGTSQSFLWTYLLFSILDLFYTIYLVRLGEQLYTEFNMSRTEWKQYQLHNEKKRFHTIYQLHSYLQEKNNSGLALKGVKGSHYIFEETPHRYDYFIDSKAGLKKRLKQEGLSFHNEKKDWYSQSTNWYELSIANAAKYHLVPIAVMHKSLLVYRRPFSTEPLPWANSKESLWLKHPLVKTIFFFSACFLIGCLFGLIAGYTAAILSDIL